MGLLQKISTSSSSSASFTGDNSDGLFFLADIAEALEIDLSLCSLGRPSFEKSLENLGLWKGSGTWNSSF